MNINKKENDYFKAILKTNKNDLPQKAFNAGKN